jgi:aspartyl protease family protein
MRAVAVFAAVAIVAGISVPRYSEQLKGVQAAPTMMTARPAASVAPTNADSRSVVVPRDDHGHFRVGGRIDGRRLEFMVDTGASVIALTERDAAMLGIHPAESEYRALVKTANGTVRAAPARLSKVEIEDIVVRDVDAMVLPDSALGDNLLGLSFLSRLSRFEYSNGKLVLEQ